MKAELDLIPKGTIVACPNCGRRMKIAVPTIAAACRATNTRIPKPHPITMMRAVQDVAT